MQTREQKNKKTLEWYYKHREELIKKNREWKKNNKDKLTAYGIKRRTEKRKEYLQKRKEWRIANKRKLMEYNRRPEVKERAKLRIRLKRERTNHTYDRQHYQKNKEKIRAYHKVHSQIPEVKARKAELARIRRRNNPQSNRSYPLELQFAMNRVRIRDKNTCQWYKCGLAYRQAPIHVHHIFPINEHPELELEEKYMICYCANHHAMFHRMRGDWYSEMINPRYQEGLFEPLVRGSD